MIEDPIPAGAEFIQNNDSYKIPSQPDIWNYWFTRQEFHDDRAAIFATDFDGRHESFYLLKVVNLGDFSISPARVELMYQPRSRSDKRRVASAGGGPAMTNLRLAFARLRAGVVMLQWFGNLVLMLLAFAWLQIPDSHTWQFLFSLITALALVLAFLGLHAHTFRKLGAVPLAAPWRLRLLMLFVVILVGYFLLQLIGVGRGHEPLFAGYWNSRFPAAQRSFFTFQRLVEWQDHFYDLLQWLLAALLLPIAFVGAATDSEKAHHPSAAFIDAYSTGSL